MNGRLRMLCDGCNKPIEGKGFELVCSKGLEGLAAEFERPTAKYVHEDCVDDMEARMKAVGLPKIERTTMESG